MSPTDLANKALGRIGAKRINDIDSTTDTSNEMKQITLHYESTKRALIRSFQWNFAKDRATLSLDTNTPDHEWDNAFLLPNDYIRLIQVYGATKNDYSLEGKRILTNYDEIQIKYIKNVSDTNEFDDLFTDLFALKLAINILPALAGASGSESLYSNLYNEYLGLMKQARTINLQEDNATGDETWNESRV